MPENVRLLAELTGSFNEAVEDEAHLLGVIATQVAAVTGDACTVRLLSDDGLWLHLVSVDHSDPEIRAGIWSVMGQTAARADAGIWAPIIGERRTIQMPVSASALPPDSSPPQIEFMRRYPIRHIAGAALVSRGRVLGGLSLVRYTDDTPFSEDEMAFLCDVADRAALAIDNARLLGQRRRAEEALAVAVRSRALLEATANGIFGVDREGRCSFMNPVAAEALGLDPEGVVGERLHDLIHHHRSDGSPYPWQECPIRRTLRTGEDVRVEGEVFWRADGSSFPVELAVRPVRVPAASDGDEALVGAVVSFTDVAERMSAPPASRSGARVLVADDNPVNQRLAALVLERMGHRVDTVANGREAVDALERIPYDAVVMDCRMPVMDGYAATREIRRREAGARHVPIVAVTASATREDADRALAAGMDAHLAKPIDRTTLEQVLDGVLRRPESGPEGPAAATGTAPLLDHSRLDDLRRVDDRGERSAELVRVFISDMTQRVEQLAVAAVARDLAACQDAAHSLSGAAFSVGGVLLGERARAVESAAVAGQSPDASTLQRLLLVARQTAQALEESLAGD